VEQTGDGGFIVAGVTVSSQFQLQTWLLRVDANGGVVWQKAYGGLNFFVPTLYFGPKAIQALDGGFFVASATNVSLHTFAAWIFKVDGNGSLVWQRAFTGIGNATAGSAIDLTMDGGLLVAGLTYATVGSNEAFALKLDNNGVIEWEKLYTGQGQFAGVFSARETSDGGAIVAGWTGLPDPWLLRLDAGGGVLWQKTYTQDGLAIVSVQQTRDGGFVGAGSNLALRFDSTGALIWQKSIGGGATRAVFFSIQQTPDDGFALAGFSGIPPSNPSSLLVRLDSMGNIIWQRSFLAGVISQALFVSLTSNGGLAVAGFDETTSSISDAWVLKLDAGGVVHHCTPLSASTLVANDTSLGQTSITGSSSDISVSLITTTSVSTDTNAGSLVLCHHGFKV
jgi:hypothetical protein